MKKSTYDRLKFCAYFLGATLTTFCLPCMPERPEPRREVDIAVYSVEDPKPNTPNAPILTAPRRYDPRETLKETLDRANQEGVTIRGHRLEYDSPESK